MNKTEIQILVTAKWWSKSRIRMSLQADEAEEPTELDLTSPPTLAKHQEHGGFCVRRQLRIQVRRRRIISHGQVRKSFACLETR